MRGEVESSWQPGVEVGAGGWEGTWGEGQLDGELGPCVGMGDLCLCLVEGSPLDPLRARRVVVIWIGVIGRGLTA